MYKPKASSAATLRSTQPLTHVQIRKRAGSDGNGVLEDFYGGI